MSAPVELYRIIQGLTAWYYTSGPTEVEFEGNVYKPAAIGRNSIESKGQIKRENLEVGFPVDNAMAIDFLRYTPDGMVYLTIFIQNNAGTFVGWKGRLSSVRPSKSNITLVFESFYTSIKSSLLSQSYSRNCRHLLYAPLTCKVQKSEFLYEATAISTDGYTVTLSSAPPYDADYYIGGVMEFANNGMRGIMSQNGAVVTLNDLWPSLSKAIENSSGSGVTIAMYPGCDRSMETCNYKFDNRMNFGGFPYIPDKNPFQYGLN